MLPPPQQKAAEAALARAEHRAAAAERDRQGLRSLLDRLTAEQAALAQEAGARAAEEGAARAEHEKTVRRLREAEEAAARRVEEARTAQAAAEAARDAAERALATARAEARSASEEARLGRDRAEVLQQRLAEARERAREADRQRARAERAAEREAEAQAEAESLRAALRAAEQEGEAADEARIRCRSLERALEDTRAEMAARLAEAADAIERLTARGRRDGDGTQWQGIAEGLAREKVTLRALAEGAVAACRAAEVRCRRLTGALSHGLAEPRADLAPRLVRHQQYSCKGPFTLCCAGGGHGVRRGSAGNPAACAPGGAAARHGPGPGAAVSAGAMACRGRRPRVQHNTAGLGRAGHWRGAVKAWRGRCGAVGAPGPVRPLAEPGPGARCAAQEVQEEGDGAGARGG